MRVRTDLRVSPDDLADRQREVTEAALEQHERVQVVAEAARSDVVREVRRDQLAVVRPAAELERELFGASRPFRELRHDAGPRCREQASRDGASRGTTAR